MCYMCEAEMVCRNTMTIICSLYNYNSQWPSEVHLVWKEIIKNMVLKVYYFIRYNNEETDEIDGKNITRVTQLAN